MLAPAYRMRRHSDFSLVVRRGARARARTVVVHQRAGDASVDAPGAPMVGFVVSRAVGPSVVRHRVTRRLRAQLALRLDRLPAGSRTVVRALPAAADAASAELGRDLDRALAGLDRPARHTRSAATPGDGARPLR